MGLVSQDTLQKTIDADQALESALLEDSLTLAPDTPLAAVIGDVADAAYGVPVVDEDMIYKGVVTKGRLLKALDREENE